MVVEVFTLTSLTLPIMTEPFMCPVGYHEDIARDVFVWAQSSWLPMMSAAFCTDVPYNRANSSRISVYVILRIEAALMG